MPNRKVVVDSRTLKTINLLRKAKISVKSISITTGLSVNVIYRVLKEQSSSDILQSNETRVGYGGYFQYKRRIEFTSEELKEIIDDYKKNCNIAKIAKQFNVSTETVKRRLKENGVELRPWKLEDRSNWTVGERVD